MRRTVSIVFLGLALTACSDDGLAPDQASNSGGSTSDIPPNSTGGLLTTAGSDDVATSEADTELGADTTSGPSGTGGSGTGTASEGTTGTDTTDASTGDSSTGSGSGSGSSGSSSGSSSDDGMMVACPEIMGTSLIGGPADLYGYCWYITAPMDTCDSACSELAGGANLALLAESSYADNCNAPIPGDVPTWFFDNGNPAGWTAMGGGTNGHTLGYGYSVVGSFYGKCSTGGTSVGTYPGEAVGGGLEDQRQLVCACAEGTP